MRSTGVAPVAGGSVRATRSVTWLGAGVAAPRCASCASKLLRLGRAGSVDAGEERGRHLHPGLAGSGKRWQVREGGWPRWSLNGDAPDGDPPGGRRTIGGVSDCPACGYGSGGDVIGHDTQGHLAGVCFDHAANGRRDDAFPPVLKLRQLIAQIVNECRQRGVLGCGDQKDETDLKDLHRGFPPSRNESGSGRRPRLQARAGPTRPAPGRALRRPGRTQWPRPYSFAGEALTAVVMTYS